MGSVLASLALLEERKEVKCFLSRNSYLNQTLCLLAILDWLCVEVVNSFGSW